MSPDGERRARVALSFLAKPGDPVLGEALRTRTASEVLTLVTGADADARGHLEHNPGQPGVSAPPGLADLWFAVAGAGAPRPRPPCTEHLPRLARR
jgi:hypothetical protein